MTTTPCPLARRLHLGGGRQVDVVELRQAAGVVPAAASTQSFWSMPAESASVPVSTRSMSTRPASCCALILPASSGAGALVKVMRETRFGFALRIVLDRLLRQREIAGDVDDVERDRARRQRQSCAKPGPPKAATPAAPATPPTNVRLVIGVFMVFLPFLCDMALCGSRRRHSL